MPTDTQIHSTQLTAAPLDYKVPLSVEILLKCVNAQFTDNGAAADWLPCLTLISDAGSVIGRSVDRGVTITAGNSAEVSWFPGVKPKAAAAAASTTVFARAYRDSLGGAPDPAQQVNAGTHANGSFPHALTTDATVMNWRTAVLTNDTVDLLKVGTYLIFAVTHWEALDTNLSTIIFDGGQDDFPHTPWQPNMNPSSGDGIGSANSQDFTVAHVLTPTSSINVIHDNKTAGNHFVQQCYFTVIYWPTT